MNSTVRLSSPADVPAVVDSMLGFTPTDSLVVLGLGGGPTARVDLDAHALGDVMASLAPAVPHWTNGVLVAVYSETVDVPTVERALRDNLGIRPRIIVAVDQHDVVTDDEGNRHKPSRPNGLPERVVRPSRESLVADAARLTSASKAFQRAVAAYLEDGDGAKAWVYLDRFTELNGGSTAKSRTLGRFLTDAINPRSDLARATFA